MGLCFRLLLFLASSSFCMRPPSQSLSVAAVGDLTGTSHKEACLCCRSSTLALQSIVSIRLETGYANWKNVITRDQSMAWLLLLSGVQSVTTPRSLLPWGLGDSPTHYGRVQQ